MYFKGAKKQASNYVLCYICFSMILAKRCKAEVLELCLMSGKQKSFEWSAHLIMFFNPLMLVVTKWHTYLKQTRKSFEGLLKYVWYLLPPGITGLKSIPEIFKE